MVDEIVSKGEFAAIIGKSAARVSQLLAEGVINGAALVGQGRSAKIRLAVARAQLAARLDPVQQLGQGRPLEAAQAPSGEAVALAAGIPDSQSRYLAARAEQAELIATRTRAENEALAGRWLVSEAAAEAWAGEMSRLVQGVETWLATSAAHSIAAEMGCNPRDVSRLLLTGFNELRRRLAEGAGQRAALAAESDDADDDDDGEPA